jgi:hypothetical protein
MYMPCSANGQTALFGTTRNVGHLIDVNEAYLEKRLCHSQGNDMKLNSPIISSQWFLKWGQRGTEHRHTPELESEAKEGVS